MRFCCSKISTLMLAGLLCVAAPLARAQQAPSDVAVVSIAPLDRLMSDTSYLLRAANVPEMDGLITIMANQYTQGIDRTKPIGAAVSLDGGMPSAVIFIPMTDSEQFFGAMAGMGIEPDDLGDGLFEIDTGGQVIFAKESDGWMHVSQTEAALETITADPSAALGDLHKNYDIAIRVNAGQIPQFFKDQALQQIRYGFEQSMQMQAAGQSEEEQKAAQEMGEASMQQLEQLINETDQLIFGWSVSSDDQRTYMDAGVKFVEGSTLAVQSNLAAETTSDYTQFYLPYSSARFRFSSLIAESDRMVVKNSFQNSLSQVEGQLDQADMPDEARELITELLASLAQIMEDSIDEGVLDGAGSVSVADNTLRILVGGHIADGDALAAAFKKAAAKLPQGPDIPKFEFDYENYKGVNLHRISGPVKIADPAAKRIFGEELVVTVGTGAKSYLIALDPTGDAAAKAAIDQMGSSMGVKASPFESVIALEDILKYAQAISPNSILDNAVNTISQYAGKDKVEITSRVIDRGALYRLSIEEGILRAVGAAAKSGGGGVGGF